MNRDNTLPYTIFANNALALNEYPGNNQNPQTTFRIMYNKILYKQNDGRTQYEQNLYAIADRQDTYKREVEAQLLALDKKR